MALLISKANPLNTQRALVVNIYNGFPMHLIVINAYMEVSIL